MREKPQVPVDGRPKSEYLLLVLKNNEWVVHEIFYANHWEVAKEHKETEEWATGEAYKLYVNVK